MIVLCNALSWPREVVFGKSCFVLLILHCAKHLKRLFFEPTFFFFKSLCVPLFQNNNLRSRFILFFEENYFCLELVVGRGGGGVAIFTMNAWNDASQLRKISVLHLMDTFRNVLFELNIKNYFEKLKIVEKYFL